MSPLFVVAVTGPIPEKKSAVSTGSRCPIAPRSRQGSTRANRTSAASWGSLAADLTAEGRYPEAEALSRQSPEVQSRVLGPDHPDTLASALNLAVVLRKQRRYAESEKLARHT
jgi:hypothetical protein